MFVNSFVFIKNQAANWDKIYSIQKNTYVT